MGGSQLQENIDNWILSISGKILKVTPFSILVEVCWKYQVFFSLGQSSSSSSEENGSAFDHERFHGGQWFLDDGT